MKVYKRLVISYLEEKRAIGIQIGNVNIFSNTMKDIRNLYKLERHNQNVVQTIHVAGKKMQC